MADSQTLQLNQNLAFQRSTWRWQRAGWIAMGFLIVAAMGGVFGQGPLSRVEVAAGGALSASYDRFARENAPARLHVEVAPAAVHDGRVELMIDREFLGAMQLLDVQPQPQRVVALSDSLLFRFEVDPAGGRIPLLFVFQPLESGSRTARLWLADGSALRLPQFVFP